MNKTTNPILDTQHLERERQKARQCLAELRQFIRTEYTSYRYLYGVMQLCFGLATVNLMGCATVLMLTLLFHTSGLGLALLGTTGAMVVFGSLGVLTMFRLEQLVLEASADLLRAQTCQRTHQRVAAHHIQPQPPTLSLLSDHHSSALSELPIQQQTSINQ